MIWQSQRISKTRRRVLSSFLLVLELNSWKYNPLSFIVPSWWDEHSIAKSSQELNILPAMSIVTYFWLSLSHFSIWLLYPFILFTARMIKISCFCALASTFRPMSIQATCFCWTARLISYSPLLESIFWAVNNFLILLWRPLSWPAAFLICEHQQTVEHFRICTDIRQTCSNFPSTCCRSVFMFCFSLCGSCVLWAAHNHPGICWTHILPRPAGMSSSILQAYTLRCILQWIICHLSAF